MNLQQLRQKRIDKLKSGDWQFGCAGMHHGHGTADCPINLHHHHDVFCQLPTIYELTIAGINPNDFKVRSRKG